MNLKVSMQKTINQRISFFLQNLQKLYNHYKARSLTARYIKVNGDGISDVHFLISYFVLLITTHNQSTTAPLLRAKIKRTIKKKNGWTIKFHSGFFSDDDHRIYYYKMVVMVN